MADPTTGENPTEAPETPTPEAESVPADPGANLPDAGEVEAAPPGQPDGAGAAQADAPDPASVSDDAATDPGGAGDTDPGIHLVDPPGLEVESQLRRQLDELQARLRAVSAAYQRQQEDVEATRQRLERQATLKEEMRRGEVVSSLFEPLENLKRSVDSAKKGATMDDTVKGLEMVSGQFMDALHKLGLEEVEGQGARFDPNVHEALTLVPVPDPALDGVVIEVFSAGYRIGARLIRPARVIVGQCQAEPAGDA